MFADHPEQWQRLREDRDLLPGAVEEVLRWARHLLYFRRNAVADVTVAGETIEPGDLVSLWYGVGQPRRGGLSGMRPASTSAET